MSGNYKTGGIVTLAPGCMSGIAWIFILPQKKTKREFDVFVAQTQFPMSHVHKGTELKYIRC